MQTLEPGTLVDERYRIIASLGEGGMGVVYQAEHVLFARIVALKVLRTGVSEKEITAHRLQREAVETKTSNPAGTGSGYY